MRAGDHIDATETRQRIGQENARDRIADMRDTEKRRRNERERTEDAVTAISVMATSAQIVAFEAKLDKYETAAATALMDNVKRLEDVRARIEALLERAYVMEDGRRVFKTEDGERAFDEFGEEVSADDLDPDLIGPQSPTWEDYEPHFDERISLSAERQKIIEFQGRIDAARDEIADGEISEADLDALDADLLVTMPPAGHRQRRLSHRRGHRRR